MRARIRVRVCVRVSMRGGALRGLQRPAFSALSCQCRNACSCICVRVRVRVSLCLRGGALRGPQRRVGEHRGLTVLQRAQLSLQERLLVYVFMLVKVCACACTCVAVRCAVRSGESARGAGWPACSALSCRCRNACSSSAVTSASRWPPLCNT